MVISGLKADRGACRDLLAFGGRVRDAHDASADDALAGAGRQVDPRFRIAVRRHVAMAGIGAGRAVVLAGLDHAGALFLLRLFGRHGHRDRCRTDRQQARHRSMQQV
jgi:hypothetical protein